MIAIAVAPMATPVRRRRTNSLGSICRIAEAGCCSKTAKLHADTMNSPRQTASIRYSGQCFVAAEIAPLVQVRLAVLVSDTNAACASSFFAGACITLIGFSADTLVTNER